MQIEPQERDDVRLQVDERPRPWLGQALGAGGGAVLAAGVVLLASETAPDDGGAAVAAAAISAVMVVLAYAAWRFAPAVVRSALVAPVVAGIAAVYAFLLLPDVSTWEDMRPFALLLTVTWAVAWAIGPLRGRALLLALALFGVWFVATGEITEPSTPAGPLVYASPFPFLFGGFATMSETCTSSASSATLDAPTFDDQGNVIGGFDDQGSITDDTSCTVESPFGEPRFGEVGFLSLGIALAFFGALAWVDRRMRAPAGRPFAIPGAIALVYGLGSIAAEFQQFWAIGVLTLGVGLFTGWCGTWRQRRFTTWFGALVATVGVVIVSVDLTDRSVGLDGSTPQATAGLALILFGMAAVAAAMLVGRLMGEESPAAAQHAAE